VAVISGKKRIKDKEMRRIIWLVVLGLFVLTACGGAGTSSSNQGDTGTLEPVPAEYAGKTNPLGADAAAEGAKVFQSTCSMCHGPQGHGDGPAGESLDPKPKNLALLQESAKDDYLFWKISEGKPGTAMVSWKGILTEEQIWQVISFIRTLKE
jgi:mono/diheme cytochrome c family protein